MIEKTLGIAIVPQPAIGTEANTLAVVSKMLYDQGCCSGALLWLQKQPSIEAAWKNCGRCDWMEYLIWVAGLGIGNKPYLDVACRCHRIAREYPIGVPTKTAEELTNSIRSFYTLAEVFDALQRAEEIRKAGKRAIRYNLADYQTEPQGECPRCKAKVEPLWSGVVCSKRCGWWFCY